MLQMYQHEGTTPEVKAQTKLSSQPVQSRLPVVMFNNEQVQSILVVITSRMDTPLIRRHGGVHQKIVLRKLVRHRVSVQS